MMVSTKGRYALMVMLDLASHDDGGYISLADVASREGLSMKYLESVVSMLNKGGLLRSLRGKKGGYRLIKSPKEYTVGEILKITEGSLAPVECIRQESVHCDRAQQCATLPLWIGLDRLIDGYLDQITLQDVLDGNRAKMLGLAEEQAKEEGA